jgi:hypothetical protein
MSENTPGESRKFVRVAFPAEVEFAGEKLRFKEFSANLSEGDLFLPTELSVEPGTRGRLTFRISQWEDPFSVDAEVVYRQPPPTAEGQSPAGLGMRFIDPGAVERLLENPRLTIPHVRQVLRDTRMSTRLMLSLRRQQKWFGDEEVRYSYCKRLAAPLPEVQSLLPKLTIKQLELDPNLRPQVRTQIKTLIKNPRGRGT